MKNTLLTLSIATMMFAQNSFGQASNKNEQDCDTSYIDISTGMNHETGEFYPFSNDSIAYKDQYWLLTKFPTNTLNLVKNNCAEVTVYSDGAAWTQNELYGKGISYLSKHHVDYVGFDAGMHWHYNPSTCGERYSYTEPLRFSRYFEVKGTTSQAVTINLSGYGDDIMFIGVDINEADKIMLLPSSGANILYHLNCVSTTTSVSTITKTVTLVPGVHKIDVECYDISGQHVGISLSGSISTSGNYLSKNSCFGQSKCDGEVPTGDPSSINVNDAFNDIQIFPNPTSGIFNINIASLNTKEIEIQVIDVHGKIIKNNTIQNPASQISIDLSSYAQGTYFVKLNTAENSFKYFKVVKN